jgi:hypothetical protein
LNFLAEAWGWVLKISKSNTTIAVTEMAAIKRKTASIGLKPPFPMVQVKVAIYRTTLPESIQLTAIGK